MSNCHTHIQTTYRVVNKRLSSMATSKKLVKSSSRPSTRERMQACTHLHMTRLFDEYGCDQCSMCHRRPPLGWLYRCTQDFDGHLPASDFYDVDNKRFDHDAHLYTLSPSVTHAAANGQYTDDELDTLWRQKIGVRRTIRQAIPPGPSSAASTSSSSQYSLPASTTTSTFRSSESDPDTDLSLLTDYISSCRSPLEPIQEVHDDLETNYRVLPFANSTEPVPCNVKICHTCRPIYQQRAWQSINAVLNTPYRPPPKHEVTNKRISDVRHVKTLGLTTTSVPNAHEQRLLGLESSSGTNGSRTKFADIIQQLLKEQENSPAETISTPGNGTSYELKRVPAAYDLLEPTTATGLRASPSASDDGDALSDKISQASSTHLRPLYYRQGCERLTSLQQPTRKIESRHGEPGIGTLAVPSLASQSSISYPAKHGSVTRSSPVLRIDTAKANENPETIVPPQKTPTESIKESLAWLGAIKKSASRFAID